MTRVKNILTKNDCYSKGRKRSNTLGVLIHSTATPGATPDNFVKSWNTPKPNGRQVCVHAFLGGGKVIETLPLDWRCWGCGSGNKGSYNNSHIQVEICEPSGVYFGRNWEYKIKEGQEEAVKSYIKQSFEDAAIWAATVLHEYNFTTVDALTVTSHYEAHALGYGSGHTDPQGYFGLIGKTMNDFRQRVRELIDAGNFVEYTDTGSAGSSVTPSNPNNPNDKPSSGGNVTTSNATVKLDYARSFNRNYSKTYSVTAKSGLWLRSGAGTNKTKITCMPFGTKVRCYGYFTAVNGVPWFFVATGGRSGFCSSQYLV